MKVQVRRVDRAAMTERGGSYGSAPGEPEAPVWVIEEIGPARSADRPGIGGDRWLCLGIAVLGAVTGFGFIGRIAGDGAAGVPATAVATAHALASSGASDSAVADPSVASRPLTLISPVEGATVENTVVDVVGVASRKLGTVHLAVVLGGAVLGWTNVEVRAPGPLTASIPVFAPPVGVKVELVATVAAVERLGPGSPEPPVAAVRRSLFLRPGGPLALWPARILRSDARTILAVSGYAPLGVRRVRIRVTSQDDRTLATATADVKLDDARPGSRGGYALGLGSFNAELPLGAHVEAGQALVEVDWRDAIGGGWGTAVLTVSLDEEAPSHRR